MKQADISMTDLQFAAIWNAVCTVMTLSRTLPSIAGAPLRGFNAYREDPIARIFPADLRVAAATP